jgi:hypothetical protein
MSCSRDRDHVVLHRHLRDEFRPSGHEPAPFVEKIATLVGGLDLVALDMRERRLDDLARKIGALGGLGLERRAEAMHGRVPPDCGRHSSQGQRRVLGWDCRMPDDIHGRRASSARAGYDAKGEGAVYWQSQS